MIATKLIRNAMEISKIGSDMLLSLNGVGMALLEPESYYLEA
jgi:hypothetical protein